LPQGKPRVYLAIDPEHRPLLDTLAAEIILQSYLDAHR
jgi:RNase H-fold protein (predicted Holliday junction resolvase)